MTGAKFKILILLYYFCTIEVYGSESNDTTLELVHVVFRHGERTTLNFYPTDPHINETFYPIGLSGLTNKGKLMMFKLGEIFRDRYGDLLGDDYREKKVFVRSTSTERTLMSALLVMAGLWPPSEKQKWHPTLAWQPIPVLTKSIDKEDLLDDIRCKAKRKMLIEQRDNETIQDTFIKPYKDLIAHLEKHTGLQFREPRDFLNLYFILKSEDDYGLELPDWTNSIYPEPLHSAAAQTYEFSSLHPRIKKLRSGFLLKKIAGDSLAKMKGRLKPQQRRMFLYSGHDSTLGNLLHSLHALDPPHVPPYGSAVIFELHRRNQDYFLKIEYLRHPLNPEIQNITLPDCELLCPMEKFVEFLKPLFPDNNFEEMCNGGVNATTRELDMEFPNNGF